MNVAERYGVEFMTDALGNYLRAVSIWTDQGHRPSQAEMDRIVSNMHQAWLEGRLLLGLTAEDDPEEGSVHLSGPTNHAN